MESKVQTNVPSYQTKSFLKGCQCGGVRKTPGKKGCQNIVTDSPVEKPDLAIYSQVEVLAQGDIPNWDSPDIATNQWRPFRLMEEARVTVRNLSPTVPAIRALVHYAISPFGIGTRQERKLTKVINLAPNSQVDLNFPLDQSTLEGDPRVGVHILIEHPHDPSLINNAGSQVHDGGYTSESGRSFSVQVPVYNDSNFSREFNLSIMPTDLIASINPNTRVLAAREQIIATLTIQVPNFLSGAPDNVLNRAVTVVGRLSGGELIGGVTRLLRIDN
ncbi:MAG: hypothetical protein AB8G15_08635 [Saprospiraceae bacterium]